MAKVKVFKSRSNFKVKVTRSKIKRKVMWKGVHMWNMKTLSLLVWKLWQRLKFFKSRSNKVKVKIMVPYERSCHKEYTCNTRSLSVMVCKIMAKVKVFPTHAHTRAMTWAPRTFVLTHYKFMSNYSSVFKFSYFFFQTQTGSHAL